MPRSHDLTMAGLLLAAGGLLHVVLTIAPRAIGRFAAVTLGGMDGGLAQQSLAPLVGTWLGTCTPILAGGAAGGFVVGVFQSGGVAAKAKFFDFTRISPGPRLRSLFGSTEGLTNLAVALVKAAIVGLVVISYLRGTWRDSLAHSHSTISIQASLLSGAIVGLLIRVAGIMALIGVGDWGLSWFRLERQLRMTNQEMRDDLKEDAGDPMIRAQRRRRHRELARQRSLKHVATADVVMVNPTHYAVALSYVARRMRAPRVVAKGANAMAEQIRQIARRSGVPVLEQPPLTRQLFRRVKVGNEIPPELFEAVAAVLAVVYRIRRRTA